METELPIVLSAEPIFHIGGFVVTNTIILAAVVTLVLAAIGAYFRRQWALLPGKFQIVLESVIESILDLMDQVLFDRRRSERYFPLVATIFLFILVSNWFGILPGVGSIGVHEVRGGHEAFVPLFRSPASDLNFTLAIAIISVVATNFLGIKRLGFLKHWKKFFNFTNPIKLFVGLLEFISELAKMVSFSFRLFGNIFAGEVLLIIVAFLVPLFAPLPFLFLELFVGFIQAFIFAMLTLVFIGGAVTEEAH